MGNVACLELASISVLSTLHGYFKVSRIMYVSAWGPVVRILIRELHSSLEIVCGNRSWHWYLREVTNGYAWVCAQGPLSKRWLRKLRLYAMKFLSMKCRWLSGDRYCTYVKYYVKNCNIDVCIFTSWKVFMLLWMQFIDFRNLCGLSRFLFVPCIVCQCRRYAILPSSPTQKKT